MPATTRCPDCGAVHIGGTNCQDIFNRFLVLEFSDPAYGKVHFLTVACFMIQHNRYSEDGLVWIYRLLKTYLAGDISLRQLRRRAAASAGNRKRNWKINRLPGEKLPPKISWSMTITDVAVKYQDAESYCQLVMKWAHLVQTEMQPLFRADFPIPNGN